MASRADREDSAVPSGVEGGLRNATSADQGSQQQGCHSSIAIAQESRQGAYLPFRPVQLAHHAGRPPQARAARPGAEWLDCYACSQKSSRKVSLSYVAAGERELCGNRQLLGSGKLQAAQHQRDPPALPAGRSDDARERKEALQFPTVRLKKEPAAELYTGQSGQDVQGRRSEAALARARK